MVDIEAPGLAEAVVRTVREPLLILDADLRVRSANPAYYRTFQARAEETLGSMLFELGNGQWDIPALRELLEDILSDDVTIDDFEVDHHFPDLGRRVMVLNAHRLEAEGTSLILLAMQDLTERTLAREELERSNEDLERFASVASHDLQEPLRMVASYTRLLARRYEGRLDERADRYIAYAADGADRMKMLIQDLLAYSRINTQGRDVVAIDPTRTLEEVLRDFAMKIRESGASVTYDPLPGLRADPGQLRQLFRNLLENALKFAGDGPPVVHVSGRRGDGWTTISVRDEGIGIDPEYFDRVFVIFQRLHGRDKEGTGIGLALCKRIVERHGGRLWIDSRPGAGSTFSFTLPSSEDA
ncbi:MAG: ATP-binding protein [Gemmatimonadota bacterium]|nr:ATP-binding protein [Gemmatimonadota bacterium]